MEEIKVGEYVRSKRGIAKILEIKTVATKMDGKHDKAYRIDKTRMYVAETEFLKHSSNPIDLTEKGDYVNGKRVLVVDDIITDDGEKAILVENYDEWTDDGVITNKDIKSIVTHEQFAQIEYKVEE